MNFRWMVVEKRKLKLVMEERKIGDALKTLVNEKIETENVQEACTEENTAGV